MSKVILFSDLHIHPHKKNYARVNHCLEVVDWVFQTAKKYNVKDILFGGDLLHDRKVIDVTTYQLAFEKFQNWMGTLEYNLYLLLGNHDIFLNEKTNISSVYPFSALPNTKVISRPERLQIGGGTWDFIPFTHNPVETLEELSKMPGTQQYALGHIAVNDANLHGKVYSENLAVEHDGDMVKIDAALFAPYKRTFLGHYHINQKLQYNVEYIGSPLELNFGEAGEDKHIVLFDCDSNKCDYISNDFSPKHRYEEVTNVEMFLKIKDNFKGDFLKVTYDSTQIDTVDVLKLRKEIDASEVCLSFDMAPKKVALDVHQIYDANAILYQGDMLANYIDQVGEKGLDRDKLLKIGQMICEGKNG